MSVYINDNNQIILDYPKYLIDGKSYLSFDSLQDLIGLKRTSLQRLIKTFIQPSIVKFKGRNYYQIEWCILLYKYNKSNQ